jgi:replicative DNA helicase
MKFDKAFEEEVLSQALKDVNFVKKATRILDSHHFSSKQHGWTWKIIKDIWNKYRESATPKLILAKAKIEIKDDDERIVFIELIRKLYKKKTKAAEASLEELQKFVRTVNAQLALEEAATDLEKGKIEKVYDVLGSVVRKDIQPRNYTLVNWIEEFQERQEERKYKRDHPEEFAVIPTGFKNLDRVIEGLQYGELGLIVATTGKGKSIALSNLAYNAVKYKKKVLYLALEMPARQVAMRQDARWLKIAYNKFKKYDFTSREFKEISIRYEKVAKKWRGRMKIISMPIRGCSLSTIHSCLDDLYDEYGFKPDVIMIDSGDHLKPQGRFESLRIATAENYWGLKDLAEEGGYGIWSSVQAGKEWVNKIATAEATSESYDKARIADLIISLNTPENKSRTTKLVDDFGEEIESEDLSSMARGEYMELFVGKYRDGSSKFSIPLDTRFDLMLMEELEEAEHDDD